MLVEQIDDFIVLRFTTPVDDRQIQVGLNEIKQHAMLGHTVVFVDLGETPNLPSATLNLLTAEIGSLKTQFNLDISLLSNAEMSKQLNQSPLAKHLQLFERADHKTRHLANAKTIAATDSALKTRLDVTLDAAIQTALVRWFGRPPNQIRPASAEVNPTTHVVSVVKMNVDGCDFNVFLSGSLRTMRGMVEHILKMQIADGDPAILDGACELLNYLTAFLKTKLASEQSVVETAAPHLLQPDEMFIILDRDLPAQRVRTDHGSFDVWIEAAA